MAFTPIERKQLNNAVERVLHVQGNYSGGILEMAVAIDCSLSCKSAEKICKDAADSLKSHSKVFQNVRLNMIQWISDEEIVKEISAMPFLQTGKYFETYKSSKAVKKLEILTEQLKKFYARSKLILIITDGSCFTENTDILSDSLCPFLYRKLIIITYEENGKMDIIPGMQLMN